MKVVVIVNASAGTIIGSGSESFRASLAEAFRQHRIEAELRFVEGEQIQESAAKALAAARERRIDAVVVGGGDGTIRSVAGMLAGTGVPIGILPLGTLNHFAKDLGIPTELEVATAIIAQGNTRLVDLGGVNDEVFINNSSLGIYPYLVSDRERQTSETSRPKWLAAPLAFLRVLRRFPTRRLTVRMGVLQNPFALRVSSSATMNTSCRRSLSASVRSWTAENSGSVSPANAMQHASFGWHSA